MVGKVEKMIPTIKLKGKKSQIFFRVRSSYVLIQNFSSSNRISAKIRQSLLHTCRIALPLLENMVGC